MRWMRCGQTGLVAVASLLWVMLVITAFPLSSEAGTAKTVVKTKAFRLAGSAPVFSPIETEPVVCAKCREKCRSAVSGRCRGAEATTVRTKTETVTKTK